MLPAKEGLLDLLRMFQKLSRDPLKAKPNKFSVNSVDYWANFFTSRFKPEQETIKNEYELLLRHLRGKC